MGGTAFVERLPSGNAIVKTPLQNPLNPVAERMNREAMVREAKIYRLMAEDDTNTATPKFLGFDEQSCTLMLEYQCNKDLLSYINNTPGADDIDLTTRGKWATQAARALVSLHDKGVIHSDIATRNFLLNGNLDLCICDFTESFLAEYPASNGAPGVRYQAKWWGQHYVPTEADDVFGLGSVLYFIMAGKEPYSDLDDNEVVRRFQAQEFPETSHLRYASVVRDCWMGRLTTTRGVVQALESFVMRESP